MRPRAAAVASVVLIATLATAVAVWLQHPPNSSGQLDPERDDSSVDHAASAGSYSFSLTDQYGHAVTDATFRGKWLIVFFGFTHCPDVCPTTLATVAAALDELGVRVEDVQVALITIDPERDAPEDLARYLKPFGPRFVGLTGTTNQLEAATRNFRVYAQRQAPSADGSYGMQHSTYLYLLDPDGRFRRQISSDATSAELAATLSKSFASSS